MPPELNLPQVEYNIRAEDLESLDDAPENRNTYTYHRVETTNNHTFTGGQELTVTVGEPIETEELLRATAMYDGITVVYNGIPITYHSDILPDGSHDRYYMANGRRLEVDEVEGRADGGLVTFENILNPQLHIHYEGDPPGHDRVMAVDATGERRTFVHTYRTAVGDTDGDGLPETEFAEMGDRLHQMTAGIDLIDYLPRPGTELNEMAEQVNNGTTLIHQTDDNTATTQITNEWRFEAGTAPVAGDDCAVEWRVNDLDLFETLKPRIKSYIEELLQQKGYIIGKVPEETSEIPVE